MVPVIKQLVALGQSLWYDNIERRLIENGELAGMIQRGEIRGLTSNPSIFNNAIANSKDYDSALVTMAWAGYTAEQIFERLALEDIRAVADLLLPLYSETQTLDGYVSLEVNPKLAYDSQQTFEEVLRLWKAVDRPNLMVKVPATKEGLPVIRQAISAGVNVNVTLIFSLERYREVMEAYLLGLEERAAAGQPIDKIASVASFFVSRMDSKVDKLLEKIIQAESAAAERAQSLLGKAAIANARLAYQEYMQVFQSPRFSELQKKGAHVQRPLWASTSTKNPSYPDTIYVDQLIGQNTVNTVPAQTLTAFIDHGVAQETITDDLDNSRKLLDSLEEIGISIDQVTSELESEGVSAFLNSYLALLQTVEERRGKAVAELGNMAKFIPARVDQLRSADVITRMHTLDPSIWTEDPAGQAEIQIRLGWLDSPNQSLELLEEVNSFAEEVVRAGFTHVLLLGMGGSSLAPEVTSLVFRDQLAGLKFSILDSTDPGQVLAAEQRSPLGKTLYIVSSKSGGTAEVNAFLDYFWDRTEQALGSEVSRHFVAITNPDTSLHKLASERGFRRVFQADPNVGGRYSALTAFGVVPAGLMGIDLEKLLDRAARLAAQCAPDVPYERNPGLVLGAILGEAANLGRDKLTIVTDRQMSSFGSWLEQLIAESSGKQGKGIVPVDGEPLVEPHFYGDDRVFVYLRSTGEYDEHCDRLRNSGQPVLTIEVPDAYALAAEFYRWEVATAVACMILGVNPFDQPDVQDAKTRTRNSIAVYQSRGSFDEGTPVWEGQGLRVYGELPSSVSNLSAALAAFLAQGQPGDYVALNAYLPRSAHNEAILRDLRVKIRARTRLATTVGFGPRFLHSTGQLHKGGPNNGLFLQITADPSKDIEIPGQGLTFGVLERGQSLGDLEALRARGRRVMRVHLAQPDLLNLLLAAVSN